MRARRWVCALCEVVAGAVRGARSDARNILQLCQVLIVLIVLHMGAPNPIPASILPMRAMQGVGVEVDISSAATPVKVNPRASSQPKPPPPEPAIMTPSFSEEIPAIDLGGQAPSATAKPTPTPAPMPRPAQTPTREVHACACINIAPALAVLQDLYSALRRGLTGEAAARVANTPDDTDAARGAAGIDADDYTEFAEMPSHTKPEKVHLVDEHFRHDDYTLV